jgi:hypothetical protein
MISAIRAALFADINPMVENRADITRYMSLSAYEAMGGFSIQGPQPSVIAVFNKIEKSWIVSEINAIGEKSDFHGCVKNGKLFEEPATSSCHSTAMKIAPRKTFETNNPAFFDSFIFSWRKFFLHLSYTKAWRNKIRTGCSKRNTAKPVSPVLPCPAPNPMVGYQNEINAVFL